MFLDEEPGTEVPTTDSTPESTEAPSAPAEASAA